MKTSAEAGGSVTIFAAGSALHGARPAIAEFMARSPIKVGLATDHGHLIHERVCAGACAADIVIIPGDLLADIERQGLLKPGSVRRIGVVGIGYATPPRFRPPAIADAEGLAAAVIAADQLFLTTAPTGVHMRACLERMGLGGEIAGKLVTFGTASEMNRQLASETAFALSFGPATELVAGGALGLVWGGAVPAEFDVPLAYDAGILGVAADGGSATMVLDFLAGPQGLAHFAASGVS